MFTHDRHAYIALHRAGVSVHMLDMTKPPRYSIHYVMEDDLKEALKAVAAVDRRSMSFTMTEILRKAVGLPRADGRKQAEPGDANN